MENFLHNKDIKLQTLEIPKRLQFNLMCNPDKYEM